MSNLLFRLFVYGTLKSGFWNHETYCREAISIEPAAVMGRLYELPSGIPVLEVPKENIIAVGSRDICRDASVQSSTGWQSSMHMGCEQWRWIEREIIAFADPHRAIPPIARLESN